MGEPTAPGWYPDPEDPRRQRWWSGRAWTQRWQAVAPPGPPREFPPPAPAGPPVAERRGFDDPIPLDIGSGYPPPVGAPVQGVRAGMYGTSVGPIVALRDGFRRMFSWSGRSSRSAYWWLWLTSIGLTFASGAWDAYVIARYPDWFALPLFDPSIPVHIDVIATVFVFAGLGMAIAVIGAGVRRMHDVGRSGWFFLVPFYNLYLLVQPSVPNPTRWG